MKKLTHIFITALLTLCGCMPGGDRVNFVRYSYRNNTGREISVTVKFTQPYSVDPSFSIPPGESHQFTIEGGWGMPDPAPFEYDGYGYGDNDRVIVSNGVRTVVFVRSDHDSIFDLGKYTILSPGEGGNHYEFVFDEAFFTGDGTLQTRAASSGLDDNPYSLSQVQQAYNIVADSENLPAVTLTPTDYYVRFFVADSVQYLALCDMEVELFDYPMHLDLTDEEEWEYADQDPTEGMWFYTTVSPYFEFPDGITYEILDDIYIQRMATVLTRAPIEHQMSDEVWDAVLEKAFEISGYEPTPQTRGEKWYPSATVKYKTDHPQYLNTEFPLEGVKVRVSQGVNWAVVYTDEHGNTGNIERNSGRMFKKPVNYKIKWEDSRWNIRSGRNGQAKTWGPKKSTSSWNITFSGANIDAKYATAHKALYNYVYKNDDFAKTRNITICGINKLNTAVIDDAHQDGRTVGKFNWLNPALGMNAVRLWIRDPNNISAHRPNWKVEETMYHELGHASYYTALRRDGGAGHNIHNMPSVTQTGEPFPEFVAYCFMTSIYPNYLFNYDGGPALGESLFNQGFSPAQIEDIMCEEDLVAWRQAAKNLHVTNSAIVDMVFDKLSEPIRTNIKATITNGFTAPSAPVLNTPYVFSVPAMNYGIAFNGFTVSGGNYTSTNLSQRTATITFTSAGQYTVSAKYKLPGANGASYDYVVSKQFDFSLPTYTVTLSAYNTLNIPRIVFFEVNGRKSAWSTDYVEVAPYQTLTHSFTVGADNDIYCLSAYTYAGGDLYGNHECVVDRSGYVNFHLENVYVPRWRVLSDLPTQNSGLYIPYRVGVPQVQF